VFFLYKVGRICFFPISSSPSYSYPIHNIPVNSYIPISYNNPLQILQGNANVHLGRELAIEGVVVTDRNKFRKMLEVITVFTTIIVIAVVVYFVSGRQSRDLILNESSLSPSFLFSTSSSPTSVFDYDSLVVKRVAIEVSGKEALNDSTSTQYTTYKAATLKLPPLVVELAIIQLNDTKRLAQRYIVALIRASTLKTLSSENMVNLELEKPFNECNLPVVSCNKDSLLTGFVHVNTKTIGGGGMIPTEIGALLELRQITAENNVLKGTIPSEIGTLKHLRILDLKINKLTGIIPKEICDLPDLELLDIHTNFLENTIPSQVANMKKLKYMDLSNNMLSGSIPL